MSKKSKNILKGLKLTLDVSSDGRLTSDQELMIVQCLIMNKGNISKTCKLLVASNGSTLDPDICSKVAVKYYENIEKALSRTVNDKTLDETLNKSLNILSKHIDEIESAQDKSTTKALNRTTTSSLTSIVDKLTKLKLADITAFDKTANSLSEKIIKNKTLESVEKGEINDSAYSSNQISVLESLNKFRGITDSVPLVFTNINTNEVITFKSIADAGRYFNTTPEYISKRIGNTYRGWKVDKQ